MQQPGDMSNTLAATGTTTAHVSSSISQPSVISTQPACVAAPAVKELLSDTNATPGHYNHKSESASGVDGKHQHNGDQPHPQRLLVTNEVLDDSNSSTCRTAVVNSATTNSGHARSAPLDISSTPIKELRTNHSSNILYRSSSGTSDSGIEVNKVKEYTDTHNAAPTNKTKMNTTNGGSAAAARMYHPTPIKSNSLALQFAKFFHADSNKHVEVVAAKEKQLKKTVDMRLQVLDDKAKTAAGSPTAGGSQNSKATTATAAEEQHCTSSDATPSVQSGHTAGTNYERWAVLEQSIQLEDDIMRLEEEAAAEAKRKAMAAIGCSHDHTKERLVYEKTTEEKLNASNRFRLEGNSAFREKNYGLASVNYRKALLQLDYCFPDTDEERERYDTVKLSCHLNLAACKIHLRDWEECMSQCRLALELDSKNAKALYRRGMAYLHLDHFDNAEKSFAAAEVSDPQSAAVQQAKRSLAIKRVQYSKRNKSVCTAMFGGGGIASPREQPWQTAANPANVGLTHTTSNSTLAEPTLIPSLERDIGKENFKDVCTLTSKTTATGTATSVTTTTAVLRGDSATGDDDPTISTAVRKCDSSSGAPPDYLRAVTGDGASCTGPNAVVGDVYNKGSRSNSTTTRRSNSDDKQHRPRPIATPATKGVHLKLERTLYDGGNGKTDIRQDDCFAKRTPRGSNNRGCSDTVPQNITTTTTNTSQGAASSTNHYQPSTAQINTRSSSAKGMLNSIQPNVGTTNQATLSIPRHTPSTKYTKHFSPIASPRNNHHNPGAFSTSGSHSNFKKLYIASSTEPLQKKFKVESAERPLELQASESIASSLRLIHNDLTKAVAAERRSLSKTQHGSCSPPRKRIGRQKMPPAQGGPPATHDSTPERKSKTARDDLAAVAKVSALLDLQRKPKKGSGGKGGTSLPDGGEAAYSWAGSAHGPAYDDEFGVDGAVPWMLGGCAIMMVLLFVISVVGGWTTVATGGSPAVTGTTTPTTISSEQLVSNLVRDPFWTDTTAVTFVASTTAFTCLAVFLTSLC